MKNDAESRIVKAEEIDLAGMDYILETVPTSDYVRIIGSTGGDICTYRIYDDGSVFEK